MRNLGAAEDVGPAADGCGRVWPLGANQERRLAFDTSLELRGVPAPPWNFVTYRRLLGPLDTAALTAALDTLVHRHTVLRSAVRRRSGLTEAEWRAAVLAVGRTGILPHRLHEHVTEDAPTVRLGVRDLAPLPGVLRPRVLEETLFEEASTAFDPASVPALRVRLLRWSAAEHVVVMSIPHRVADLQSVLVCWRHLLEGYDAPSERLRVPLQFRDVVAWQDRQCVRGGFDEAIAFWRRQWERFGAAQIAPEDCDFARPVSVGALAGPSVVAVDMTPGSSAAIRTFARRARLSPFVLFCAAFAQLLSLRSGRSQVAFWVPFANRVRTGTEDVVGWIANAHLLGIDLSAASSGLELLRLCRIAVVDGLRFQEVPVHVVWRQAGRQLSRSDFCLNYVRLTSERMRSAHLRIGEPWPGTLPPSIGAGFELRVYDRGDRFGVSVVHARHAFDQGAIAEVVQQYQRIATALATDNAAPLAGSR